MRPASSAPSWSSSRRRSHRAAPARGARRAGRGARPHSLAVELRNHNWVAEERLTDTLEWFSERARPSSASTPRPATTSRSCRRSTRSRPRLAYLRAHGRNTEGYLTGQRGRALRLALHRRRARGDRRPRARAGRARRRGPRDVQQQPRRRRAHGGAAFPGAARPGRGARGSAAEGTSRRGAARTRPACGARRP